MQAIKTIGIEGKNYSKLLKEGSLDIEKIIEKTNLSAQKATSSLAILEIQGKVRNLGRNTYAISHS